MARRWLTARTHMFNWREATLSSGDRIFMNLRQGLTLTAKVLFGVLALRWVLAEVARTVIYFVPVDMMDYLGRRDDRVGWKGHVPNYMGSPDASDHHMAIAVEPSASIIGVRLARPTNTGTYLLSHAAWCPISARTRAVLGCLPCLCPDPCERYPTDQTALRRLHAPHYSMDYAAPLGGCRL